jgi:hypothetical protein
MTRKLENQKISCDTCGAEFLQPELLQAVNPFDAEDSVFGCPKCNHCNEGFTVLCDESGCKKDASCGFPTGDNDDEFGGYRRTCGDHMRSFEAKKEAT